MRKKIKSYTEQLINSERKYRNLIEHSIEAVIIIDTMDQIIDCNSKLLTLTGYDREELRSFKFKRLIDYEDRSVISHVGTSENFETILHTKFTLNVPVEVNILRGFSLGSQENLSFSQQIILDFLILL